MPDATLARKLIQLCKIGLIRADHIRDVTRVLMRDNSVPAGVLDSFGADDREVVLGLIERTLRDLAADENGAHNWRPLADVMAGSMSYLWLIRDIYGGGKPCGIDIEAYITAVWESSAELIESMTRPPGIRAHQPVS
jgi:hypothetical protein